MNNSKEKLASRLLYLPIDINEKVLLWLTYKGLKPVSEITASRRGNLFALAKKGIRRKSSFSFVSKKSQRIKKWIKDAELYIALEQGNDAGWHVGGDKDKVETSAKIIRQFDYESEVQTGSLFGYPEESVKAYAENRNKSDEEVEKIMVGTGELMYKNDFLKDQYFTPYIFYNIPKSKVVEESRVAKTWADTIRNDVPKLAIWFEKRQGI